MSHLSVALLRNSHRPRALRAFDRIAIEAGVSGHITDGFRRDAGADYVAFGAFFPSGTKEVTRFIDPEILHWWSELMELPCCAIGGITAENCTPLVAAGADFLAVVGAVWSHPDGPAAGVRALNAAIATAP
jgi:thiamine-phosphate diphosphorylase